jgi:hypothetical protein
MSAEPRSPLPDRLQRTLRPTPGVNDLRNSQGVRFVDVQPDYTSRTEVADIIAALTSSRASTPNEARSRAATDDYLTMSK